MIKFSKKESDKFGRKVFRAQMGQVEADILYRQMKEKGCELLILRIPSSQVGQLGLLAQAELKVLVADTLVYYKKKVEKTTPFQWPPSFHANLVQANQQNLLTKVAKKCFSGYQNHYASNPDLPKGICAEAYAEWALTYAQNGGFQKCWLLFKGEEAVGFFSMKFEARTAEGVLAGVLPNFRGQGLYRQLIRCMEQKAQSAGCQFLDISTQVQHYSVQKVLADEGMRLYKSCNTVHISF